MRKGRMVTKLKAPALMSKKRHQSRKLQGTLGQESEIKNVYPYTLIKVTFT